MIVSEETSTSRTNCNCRLGAKTNEGGQNLAVKVVEEEDPDDAEARPCAVNIQLRLGQHIGDYVKPRSAKRPKRAETHDSGLPLNVDSCAMLT